MGALDGLILGAIYSGIELSKFKKQLKECLLPETSEGVETFTYKGRTYDREKFVLLEMGRWKDEKYSSVESAIVNAEKELEKGGENSGLIAAQLSAYLRVLNHKEKPRSFLDDVL